MTPSFYGNLATAGVAESSSESAVGSALDAIRPAPGVAMDPVRSALFGRLYALPADCIAVLSMNWHRRSTRRDDNRAQLLVPDGQCGQRPVGGAARPRRRSRRQQRGRTDGSTIWVSGLAATPASAQAVVRRASAWGWAVWRLASTCRWPAQAALA